MQANLLCDRCNLRVLIVDNDERDRNDFAEMIENWGGEPILAVGMGKDLVKDAIEKKDKFRCRVALVDMRLLDDSDSRDREGLELVKALKPAKSIVVTGFAHYGAARDAMGREYGASGFVGKEENPEQLLNALINARTEACACPGNDQIKWPRGLSAIKVMERLLPDIEDADDQANQLVARLLPNKPVRLKPFSGTVRSISPTPYRRSVVLRAEIDKAEPLVVKFTDKARIEREVEAFEKFIDGNLMDKRYARIKESKTDFDLGALIYDFLGSSLDRMDLFSEYYAKANLPSIQNVITQIFNAWKSHYQVSRYIKESLYDLYDRAWSNKWRARLEEFQDRRQLYPPAALAAYKLPYAVQWTLKYAVTSAPTNNRVAITHGDMHGDNIYVDRDNKVWQSDFERSGLGPIHRDFVQLELDLLTRLLPYAQGDAQPYFELIVALLCEEPQLNSSLRKNAPFSKTFDTILFLRQQAESVVGFTRERDAYSWGLLFTALFRATSIANQMNQFNGYSAVASFTKKMQRKPNRQGSLRGELERLRVLASCICHRLEVSDGNWPPDGWQLRK